MMDPQYTVTGKCLSLHRPDGSMIDVEFDWPIAEVVATGDRLVVRLEPKPGACHNENVFGVDATGNVTWKVPVQSFIYQDSPYTGIVEVDGNVKLFNWDGTEVLVDPHTGTILHEGYGR